MDSSPKRACTDAAAATPSDTAVKTPMDQAKATINASVVSLRPELATILVRLGEEYVLCLHKQNSKTEQVDKLEKDDDYVPISARVKFSLRNSKLVEQEQDYQTLVTDTATLVQNFQKDLKSILLLNVGGTGLNRDCNIIY